jgi:hypothetical protein
MLISAKYHLLSLNCGNAMPFVLSSLRKEEHFSGI